MVTQLTAFLIYAALFRAVIVGTGLVSIVLGYRLFVRGVMRKGNTQAGAAIGSVNLTVKNAAPGTCFALFGAGIIVAMVVQGSPELVLESVVAKTKELVAAETPEMKALPIQTTLRVKGGDEVISRFDLHLADGIARERAGDLDGAREAYVAALAESDVSMRHGAAALNQIAFGYFRQNRIKEALALARVAVSSDPRNAVYLDTLARTLLADGETQASIKYAEAAIALVPGNEEFQRTLEAARKAAKRP